MGMKLVSSNRESDGKFALRLESAAAIRRDAQREEARRQREAQVIAENAEWAAAHGFAAEDMAGIFA